MKMLPTQIVKNPTPNQIAVSAAFFVSIAVALIGLLFLFSLNLSGGNWLIFLLLGAVAYFAAFFTFRYYLKTYIYRKVIYKSIHKQKMSTSQKLGDIDMNADIMGDVEKEVEEWADNQEKEIRQLRTWQDYRRKFLGDISHELKTPIFNIQGYLETLLDGGLEDPSINNAYVKRAAKNVERLNTIVEDLEIISRLESGELILDMQQFDIRALAEEVFEDLEIKAAVADNGFGMEEAHLKHVFDRFYRVDKSRSREQGGSGLGLSIVKHIMEAHKQTINVRSTPGVGSTCGFTLQKVK